MHDHPHQSAPRTTLWSMVLVVLLLLPAIVHGVLMSPCASDKDCDTTSEECSGNDKCMSKTCVGPKGTCIDYDSSTYCNAAYTCVRRLSAGAMCSLPSKNDPAYVNLNACQDGLTCDAPFGKCVVSTRSNTTSTTSSSSRTTTPVPSAAGSTPTSASSATNSTTGSGSAVENAGSSSGLTMAQILIIVAAVVAGLLLVVFAIRWRRSPKAAQDARHSPVPASIPAVSQVNAPVDTTPASVSSSGAGAQLVSAKATPQNGPTTAAAMVSNVAQRMTSVVVVEAASPPPPPPPLPARDNLPNSPATGAHRDNPALYGTVAVAVDPDPLFLRTSGQQAADPLFLPTTGPPTAVPDPLYLPTTPAPARQPVVDDELYLPPSQNTPRS
ncbi:hypothetical protein AMAG_00017 [Allomyces macrogynus ATCC 38327]|uniref:Uncharacterized protein n=1 Tax=Allomyces macrogynus (strain ATCC 38327) TaxID=578462 RepID=A0A0L0RVC4_ALLM3|nr:hypothetical protein AMAG_00017 [Allomyces macrogynus ATCC 38327]|eukprot:KNE54021.1 hypothetical protein AMAG_00017 [Allomyces macrogynus ATCC 38327]